MLMNKHLTEITEKINKLKPERLELKFGCEIKLTEDSATQMGWNHCGDIGVVIEEKDDGIETNIGFAWKDCIEILGPPVTITEVLWAMGKKEKKGVYYINEHGELRREYLDDPFSGKMKDEHLMIFKLSQGPYLRDQSEEVISKVNEIL